MPTSARDASLTSLQDDFAELQKGFERDFKATVAAHVFGMDLFHAVQHLCHVNVIIFERDHEQRIAIDRAAGSGDHDSSRNAPRNQRSFDRDGLFTSQIVAPVPTFPGKPPPNTSAAPRTFV